MMKKSRMIIVCFFVAVCCLFVSRLVEGRSYRRDENGVFESEEEPAKRQFNEYGHMRFGKRGGVAEDKFDDYGYMRFGRQS